MSGRSRVCCAALVTYLTAALAIAVCCIQAAKRGRALTAVCLAGLRSELYLNVEKGSRLQRLRRRWELQCDTPGDTHSLVAWRIPRFSVYRDSQHTPKARCHDSTRTRALPRIPLRSTHTQSRDSYSLTAPLADKPGVAPQIHRVSRPPTAASVSRWSGENSPQRTVVS